MFAAIRRTEKLNAKRAELQVILDKLQKLNDFFAEKSREKKSLEDDIDNCEKKLARHDSKDYIILISLI